MSLISDRIPLCVRSTLPAAEGVQETRSTPASLFRRRDGVLPRHPFGNRKGTAEEGSTLPRRGAGRTEKKGLPQTGASLQFRSVLVFPFRKEKTRKEATASAELKKERF